MWQFLIVSKRCQGTLGDEKGGVWLYSTESDLTPDIGYSLAHNNNNCSFFITSCCVHF